MANAKRRIDARINQEFVVDTLSLICLLEIRVKSDKLFPTKIQGLGEILGLEMYIEESLVFVLIVFKTMGLAGLVKKKRRKSSRLGLRNINIYRLEIRGRADKEI